MALHIIDVAPTGGEVMASTSTVRASGTAPDHRKLNGPQTTGREYRSLSEPEYGMRRDDDVPVPMRDGVRLLADVHRPDSDGRFPAMNVPLHLPGTFTALRELADRTTVRVGMLGKFGLTWPWESLHVEALAWFDHWLNDRDTGILDGPPIRYWMPGADQWRTATAWPPPGARHRELALRADGGLSDDEGTLGQRSYRCLGTGLNHVPADPAAEPPSQLTWTSAPLDTDVDMVGDVELRLTATTTAADTAWIAVLQDVDTTGGVSDVTAGWLRASVREVDESASRPEVDESASRPGAPVLRCRTAEAVPPREPVNYRIPLVPNARRFAAGHCIRLVLTSDDQSKGAPAIMEFRHAPVGTSTTNTISSASRLLFPVLDESDGGLDA
jgi:uncharacterized protein